MDSGPGRMDGIQRILEVINTWRIDSAWKIVPFWDGSMLA